MKFNFIILSADICRCAVLYHIPVYQLLLQHQTPKQYYAQSVSITVLLTPKNAYLTGNNPITVIAMATSFKNMYLAENTAPFP